MIDSICLQEIKQICTKLAIQQNTDVNFIITFGHTNLDYKLQYSGNYKTFNSITCLISALIKLINLQPKYSIGQEVFGLDDREIYSFIVDSFYFGEDEKQYIYQDKSEGWDICEEYLYPSREELINDQIKHWESLKNG